MAKFVVHEKKIDWKLKTGEEIPYDEAEELKNNFRNNTQGTPTRYSVKFAEISKFISASKQFKLSFDYELAFRMYLGKDSNSIYNIIIMPVLSLKKEVKHEQDKEKSLFDFTRTKFFALDVAAGDVSRDRRSCNAKIKYVDASEVKLVFFSFDSLDTFVTRIGGDYDEMVFEFARLENKPEGKLSVVISCKLNGRVLSSNEVGNSSVIEGVFFDRGDLIPPPPKEKDDPIDDSFFEQEP